MSKYYPSCGYVGIIDEADITPELKSFAAEYWEDLTKELQDGFYTDYVAQCEAMGICADEIMTSLEYSLFTAQESAFEKAHDL